MHHVLDNNVGSMHVTAGTAGAWSVSLREGIRDQNVVQDGKNNFGRDLRDFSFLNSRRTYAFSRL